MATIEVSGPELLKAVQQLEPEEFDAFLEQAISLRKPLKADTLSAKESRLIMRINRGLPDEVCRRYAQLIQKREKRRLSSEEHTELLNLTHEVETRDVERAAALVELAKLRRIPLGMLMKQMCIEALPPHG